MTTKRSSNVVRFFPAGEVADLSGLTKHMIDYLCRHGLLIPSGSSQRGYGKHRQFSFTDVLLAKSIKELLDAGVSVLNMRKSFETLSDLLGVEVSESLRRKYIVIRGGMPILLEPGRPPVDLIQGGQLTFGFVLDIADLWKQAEKLRKQRLADAKKRLQVAQELRRRRIA